MCVCVWWGSPIIPLKIRENMEMLDSVKCGSAFVSCIKVHGAENLRKIAEARNMAWFA